MLKIRPILLLLALAACLGAVAGCGDDVEPSAADRSAQQAQEELEKQPAAEEAEPVTAEKVEPAAGEGDLSTKPKIAKPTGDPPKELVAQDLIVGEGAEAKTGAQVSVQYVGNTFKANKEFDASWDGDKAGDPFQFQLGSGNVIQGWDRGVVGMKVGGRRKLIIPPDLAYGEQGSPPDIGKNETLVFIVDLKKVA